MPLRLPQFRDERKRTLEPTSGLVRLTSERSAVGGSRVLTCKRWAQPQGCLRH